MFAGHGFEAAPGHLGTVLAQELRGLEGVALDAAGEAGGTSYI